MRGSAVPTMVWSSAASSSASITPVVARTLMRVVSSPCGIGFSLLDAKRLDAALTQPEAVRPALHARVELLSQDADGGERLCSGFDFSALPLQHLADPGVEQEALRVGLELYGVEFRLGSELTHIYMAHYHI